MDFLLLSTAAEATGEMDPLSMVLSFLPFVAVIGVMYFVMIRPQRKKEKETQKMRSEVQVGDTITTIGGIVGIIVSIKDDTVLIETGADKAKLRFKKWAINEVEKLITE